MTVASRRVELSGCINFRDVGGYPAAGGRVVKTGRIFRSDGLHALTPDDVARIRDEFGVRTVFDLRSPAEVDQLSLGELYDDGTVQHLAVPLFTALLSHWELGPDVVWTPDRSARLYFDFVELGRGSIAAVFEELAEPSAYAAVLHCVAGRDRTGVLCALLHDLLGVAEDDIVADYLLTEQVNFEFPMHAAVMSGLLERVRASYGSAEGYLLGCGVTADRLDAVRQLLLD